MNKFYRHKDGRSACVEVLKRFYIPEGDRVSLKVSWYKWSPKRGVMWPLGYTHRIKITRQEWQNNWLFIK